ncbi:MAG: hypothetical protein CL678_01655 [Bdellovibrionaceae bacterium]|nr:hypothetical protein [Pseudobdellovibrionaceae bacterium]
MHGEHIDAYSRQFIIESLYDGTHQVISMTGLLNEDVNLGDLVTHMTDLNRNNIRFQINLKGVTQVNSCGAREWLLFVEAVRGRMNIELIELSPEFLDQINMMPSFLGKNELKIKSFYLPYYLRDDNSTKQILMKTDQIDIDQICANPLGPLGTLKEKGNWEPDFDVDEYFYSLRENLKENES